MQRKGNFGPTRTCSALVLAAALAGLALAGCGKQVPYPEPEVTSPLNRPGECAHCEKKIESVGEDNLVVFDGIQYIVCDEECADGVKEWLKQLDGR